MKSAYADPPYLGCGKYYSDLHPESEIWNDPETHRLLIERLYDEFDSWALSLHTPSLQTMLNFCKSDIRIGAWVKPFASFKPGVTRAYAWEPILFHFSRKRPKDIATWRDFIQCPITLKRGFIGAKPELVCFWIFDGLGLTEDDEFVDLFPGSFAVTEAWEKWKRRNDIANVEQKLISL